MCYRRITAKFAGIPYTSHMNLEKRADTSHQIRYGALHVDSFTGCSTAYETTSRVSHCKGRQITPRQMSRSHYTLNVTYVVTSDRGGASDALPNRTFKVLVFITGSTGNEHQCYSVARVRRDVKGNALYISIRRI